jgi:hypothetical protein
MAIVKATYTKSSRGAKASIRYIEHRPGKDNAKMNRILFGMDGAMGRWQAYQMIDEAERGSLFFRFVISPDPKHEDTERDLFLREITEKTMLSLEDRIHRDVHWVAAIHDDHAPHRHVHVVAVVPGRLHVQDFQAMRTTATAEGVAQRQERDLANALQKQQEQEAQWALQR